VPEAITLKLAEDGDCKEVLDGCEVIETSVQVVVDHVIVMIGILPFQHDIIIVGQG
jgi:hypothetical protein